MLTKLNKGTTSNKLLQSKGFGFIGVDVAVLYKFNDNNKYLKKLPGYGIILPSGIKDTVERINGRKTVVQRLNKVIFDGSSDEKWWYDNSLIRFSTSDIKDANYLKQRTAVYIEGYDFNSMSGFKADKSAFLSGSSLFIYNYEYTSVEDFRAYLAENQLEVYYELKTPIQTKI